MNDFRAGYAAVVGLPNAGKSTLVNQIIGEKVGIITDKPQTTRGRCLGIDSTERGQIIFMDSPGYVKAEGEMNTFLHAEFFHVLKEADAVILVLNLDAQRKESLISLTEKVRELKKPWMVVISKHDGERKVRSESLISFVETQEVPWVKFSSLWPEEKKKGALKDIQDWTLKQLPFSPGPLFPPTEYTTQNLRQLLSECVREKAFLLLNQEVPYGLAVKVIRYEEDETLDRAYLEILVQRLTHKKIVVGSGGSNLKKIGTMARLEFEKRIGKKLYLQLQVKESPWLGSQHIMKELGYVHQT